MRGTFGSCFLVVFSSGAMADSPAPPVSDPRVPVSTLVREDLFAGWQADDLERHERGMKNIELLLEQRPHAKADLLAWKGGGKYFGAILAHEAKKSEAFEALYQEALALFAEARKLDPKSGGVPAIVGGSNVLFADRLPEKHRAKAWSEAYDHFLILWGQQSEFVDRMPVHIRGELLAGLAQSAQRTGRQEELGQYLDKIMELLPGTAYEREAQRWKDNPERAATGNISCKSCHSDGRLAARMAKLEPIGVEEK
jgi:tetratricopeptide (TPR) repeat protein